ncbi:MAG TPA: DNA polymerase III subunit gamma/tau, partial [bacterium]|nr:DNA polymerase III subunit gamma/tau [bacterium]
MGYLVFARKYRPQNFKEVIGQEHITATLSHALKSNRLAHAYLFSGPRGTGKTTLARILAKSINCQEGPTPEPCEKCSACKSINLGETLDIIEIDAASNRTIDDIRELRENVKFAPAHLKYKVYIIDEAHQITRESFNAVLKTLEEPPPYVLFIFCTTEVHKFPDTILSRCQQHYFRLLTLTEIKKAIQKISLHEKIKIDEAALTLLAKSARGSLRDGLSLFDQLVSYSKEITLKDVTYILGIIPQEVIFNLIRLILEKEKKEILKSLHEIVQQGWRLDKLLDQLRDYFCLILELKFKHFSDQLTDEEKKSLADFSASFTEEELIWILEVLSQTQEKTRWSEDPLPLIELNLLKLSLGYVPLEKVIEALEKNEDAAPVSPQASASPKKTAIPEPKKENPEKNSAPLSRDQEWEAFSKKLSEEKPFVSSFMKTARAAFSAEENKLTILFPAGSQYQKSMVEKN